MSIVHDTPAAPLFPRKPDNTVDWRALVRAEFLYCKSEHKETVAKLLGKTVAEVRDLSPEDIAKVPDRYLVIRKAGILELARLRGWVAATPEVQHAQRDYVIVRTVIDWAPFEGEPAKRSGGVGEACAENTTRLGAAYLAATAENRAFARAVRSFLEIDIVCSDELGDKGLEPEQETSSSSAAPTASSPMDLSPQGCLARAATECSFTFDQVKGGALARWIEDTASLAKDAAFRRRIENDPAAWSTFKDVPPRDCQTLIALIKARKAALDAAAKAKAAAVANPEPAAPAATTVQAETPPEPAAKGPARRSTRPARANTSAIQSEDKIAA